MRLVLGLAAVALLAGPALAQRQPMRQGSLLANKSVQEELKLSEDQVKKATDVEKTIGDKRTEEMGKLSQEERRGDKGREVAKKFNDELTAELSKVLKPDQQTRYKQIQFQQSVSRALSGGGGRRPGGGGMQRAFYEIPSIADAMKFSDDQKEKLKSINEENTKKVAEARKEAGDDRAKAREAAAKVVKETMESVKKVLTSDQKKKWEEMSGKPFMIKIERPGTSL